ncbi:uncharacterized protein LOC113497317 [Trichoplusia ni]|uniref:Uncharacterized protein LOC113497317 n=1 Tax=Trichoplusia ni TaxID=7111 RepID=A0A7E5VWB9_TRINI|nr:uncharacterized protein LOC113497317 [Trichoplusia ni]
MRLPSPMTSVLAAFMYILMLASMTSAYGLMKTWYGKSLPWKTCFPMSWGVRVRTYFFDRVINIILSDEDAELGYVPLSTGVILDRNRVLTSYNPFKKISKSASMIPNINFQMISGRRRESGMCYHTLTVFEMWSGRQVTFTPDESIPIRSWHGRGAERHSPVHDLMVFRVVPAFEEIFNFSNLQEHEIEVGMQNLMFKMPVAKHGDKLEYPLQYCQMNINGRRSLQYYFFVTTDDVIVNCDSYIPKFWGHFICLRNIHNIRGLTSGALLVSNQTLFGVGSFALKREQIGILVFTDVRPYHDLIMNAMTDEDTKEENE